ncbi:MAG TPA: CotH kinase family protein [Ignavibacteriaceae bacterium]|nr:CotH kinase family protein [Ignavibacteriaceae bacterium]
MHNNNHIILTIICVFFFVSRNYGQSEILESSNLPLIVIDTHGKSIRNNVKIDARIKIIYNDPPEQNYVSDPGNIYDGNAGIEIRGTYSATLPQKPYAFETRDSLGNNLNVPILNLKAENDWILLANYNDKTFIRNILAFDLFAKMGHYQPSTRICEVVVNNVYQGIYILTEKIKRDKNRVNICKLTTADTSGDDVTGGYIIKIDYDDGTGNDGWQGSYPAIDRTSSRPYYIYTDPKPVEILDKQKFYIQSFIKEIDSVLRSSGWKDPINGYRKYLNVPAFIDYFILGEVSRNVDAYKKSAYFYKDRDDKDGRLQPGPVWDFDWAWKNINECLVDAIDGSGWTYLISSVCRSSPVPPGWVVKLLDDPSFTNELYTRYNQLRKTILSDGYFNHYIDSVSALVSEAQVRHYQKWPILGINVGTPEVDEQPQTYEGEIQKFKNWISTRIHWLDSNMPGTNPLEVNTQNMNPLPYNSILYQNYPNPFNPKTKLSFVISHSSFVTLKVYDVLGNEVASLVNEKKPAGEYEIDFDASDLTSGIYLYKLQTENYVETKKMILIK